MKDNEKLYSIQRNINTVPRNVGIVTATEQILHVEVVACEEDPSALIQPTYPCYLESLYRVHTSIRMHGERLPYVMSYYICSCIRPDFLV